MMMVVKSEDQLFGRPIICTARPTWAGALILSSLFVLTGHGRATLQDREDARREGPGDRASKNLLICKAAFEKALFVYPDAHLEMRQGARSRKKNRPR
jgi:hypothetical protein